MPIELPQGSLARQTPLINDFASDSSFEGFSAVPDRSLPLLNTDSAASSAYVATEGTNLAYLDGAKQLEALASIDTRSYNPDRLDNTPYDTPREVDLQGNYAIVAASYNGQQLS